MCSSHTTYNSYIHVSSFHQGEDGLDGDEGFQGQPGEPGDLVCVVLHLYI